MSKEFACDLCGFEHLITSPCRDEVLAVEVSSLFKTTDDYVREIQNLENQLDYYKDLAWKLKKGTDQMKDDYTYTESKKVLALGEQMFEMENDLKELKSRLELAEAVVKKARLLILGSLKSSTDTQPIMHSTLQHHELEEAINVYDKGKEPKGEPIR